MEAYEKACEEVKTAGDWSKSIPNARKLVSYGLFKLVSAGDNTSSRPWAVQFEACAKHDAWENRCGAAQLMFCFVFFDFLWTIVCITFCTDLLILLLTWLFSQKRNDKRRVHGTVHWGVGEAEDWVQQVNHRCSCVTRVSDTTYISWSLFFTWLDIIFWLFSHHASSKISIFK